MTQTPFAQQKLAIRTAMQTQNFVQAKQLLAPYTESEEADAEFWEIMAYVNVKLNDIHSAISAYKKAIHFPPVKIDIYNNLGFLQQSLGQFSEAINNFENALSIDENNLNAMYNLALAHASIKNLSTAEELYRKVIKAHPQFATAYINLGNILRDLNRIDDAISLYEKALQHDTNSVLAHINLATLLEKNHDLNASAQHCEAALSLQANSHAATLTLATVKRRLNDLEGSKQLLEKSIALATTPTEQASSYSALGKTLEKLDLFDEAYLSFENANQACKAISSELNIDSHAYMDNVNKNLKLIENTIPSQWPAVVQNKETQPPVFIVGFPRSGTTLMEQILVSHPSMTSSEEAPIITQLVTETPALFELDTKYPECIPELTEAHIKTLRKHYWEMVENYAGDDLKGKRFIDKQPLNITEASLIYRLFPDAHFIVLIRDPRDVCLSCYTNTFALNQAMVNFLDLSTTTTLYNSVMNLWGQYRTKLPIKHIEVRYENLVNDMPSVTQKILTFIDEEWDDSVLDFFNTAKDRYVKTPSYESISTPVYSSSIGRWKNFRQQMEAITPELESITKKLGYSYN